MTDLTFAILKYGLLAGLWLFVWLAVRALNRDVEALAPRKSRRDTAHRERETHMVAVGESGPVIVPVDTPQTSQAPGPQILTIIDGPLSGTTMQLNGDPITLGRAANNTLVLNDEFVSSHHACVYLDAASHQWAVEDLDSTNGTKVAQQQIHGSCILPAGVPVRIGATTFELR